jgi:methylaspartate mutase epsilon subunit
MDMENKKWPLEKFLQVRAEVLSQWIPEKDLDLEKALEYLIKIPGYKSFPVKLKKAKENGRTLVQAEGNIELLPCLQDEGEADLLSSTVETCEGHGIAYCRKVFESINLPLQARHCTQDPRLLSEIIHASGWTSNEGGGISCSIPYSEDVALEKMLLYWQYCDRLAGCYEEQGIQVNREIPAPCTNALVPPSMSNAVIIIETLLAAEQGVKNITLCYKECGNLIQDAAALMALEEQTEERLRNSGYSGVFITTSFNHCMGGFPEDKAKASGVIAKGAAAAALAGATKVILKTPHEAMAISAAKTAKIVLDMLQGQKLPVSKELETETTIIKAETKCILDEVYNIGKGDLTLGVIAAFESGVIDVPSAQSKYNPVKMMTGRDNKGAVRYSDFGNVPLSEELKNYNNMKLQERGGV